MQRALHKVKNSWINNATGCFTNRNGTEGDKANTSTVKSEEERLKHLYDKIVIAWPEIPFKLALVYALM
ncbi:MAG TPA: hypothetical protein VGO47_03905 [Chlamydiales bacterium]|nr:hypothetical protein [Chlamydiales bacterium]